MGNTNKKRGGSPQGMPGSLALSWIPEEYPVSRQAGDSGGEGLVWARSPLGGHGLNTYFGGKILAEPLEPRVQFWWSAQRDKY